MKEKIKVSTSRAQIKENSKCGQKKEESIKHKFTSEENKENLRRWKKWNLGRFDNDDCEIRSTDITIYDDGHFKVVTEYHDHGKVFGDTFDIKINLWGPAPHDELIYFWEWSDELGAGDDVTKTIETIDPSTKIKENFDRIEAANRELGCKPRT
jgi:hypothetical protein